MLTLFIFILLLIAAGSIILLWIKIEQIRNELLRWISVTEILRDDIKAQIEACGENENFLKKHQLKDRLFIVNLLLTRLTRPEVIKNLVKDSCEFKLKFKKGRLKK